MALNQISTSYPIFTDKDGSPLDDGCVYIGEVGKNPETNPVQVYWDVALTQPAPQPIRTSNGYAWRMGTPSNVYANSPFSMTVKNKKSELVIYSPVNTGVSADASFVVYQPSGVGSVETTVQDYLDREEVNLWSFLTEEEIADTQTANDPTINLTSKFNLAMDELEARGGGKLLIPAGKYKMQMVLNRSNVHVVGYGAKIGYGPWETMSVWARQGVVNLGPYQYFDQTTHLPTPLAAGAVASTVVNAVQGTRMITVTSTAGMSAGKDAIIISGTLGISTPQLNHIPITHQIVRITEIDGNNVYIDEPLDATVTSLSDNPWFFQWDFVRNVKVEGVEINNQYGAAYCNSFGGAIDLTLENITFRPSSAWGAWACCRRVTINNCELKNAYAGFSNGRMSDEITVSNTTVSCTDANNTSQRYFFFTEENVKRLVIHNCRGYDAKFAAYGGSGWTDILISDSHFEMFISGQSAFQVTTMGIGKIRSSNCTYIARGGTTYAPWDEPGGAVCQTAYSQGKVHFDNCTVIQMTSGGYFQDQHSAGDTIVVSDCYTSGPGNYSSTSDFGNVRISGDGVTMQNGSERFVIGGTAQSGQMSVDAKNVRTQRAMVTSWQDDANGGNVCFGANAYSKTVYSAALTRPSTEMNAWAVRATTLTSTYESQAVWGLYHVTAGGAQSLRNLTDADGNFAPGTDNALKLGKASNRWSEVFAGNGTINTSDAREKTQVRPLSSNEIEAAKQLAKEIGSYQWLASISAKGDSAREHIGMTVQRAIEIMQNNGLDAMRYGFICFDKWEDIIIEHPEVEAKEAVFDENGNVLQEAIPYTPATTEILQTAGDRYSFRMDQLLMFIARGFEARLETLENRN